MSRNCPQCQAPVEDHQPFCPQCRAPLVRVKLPEPEAAAAATEGQSFPDERKLVQWSSALPKCLATAVASVLVLALFAAVAEWLALLAVPLLAAATVAWYGRRWPVSASIGVRIGAMSGFFCFLMNALLGAAQYLLNREAFLATMKQAMERSAASSADPRARDLLQKLLESPESLMALLLVGSMFVLALFVVLGIAGGALAGARPGGTPRDSA
jgi:hypothetical protein